MVNAGAGGDDLDKIPVANASQGTAFGQETVLGSMLPEVNDLDRDFNLPRTWAQEDPSINGPEASHAYEITRGELVSRLLYLLSPRTRPANAGPPLKGDWQGPFSAAS